MLAILIPLSAFLIENWWENNYQSVPVYESVFKEGETKPQDYHFINQYGENIHAGMWANSITVVDFFFTSCPTICPKMTNNLKKVQEQFGSNIQILSFTVDPEHDTPEKLSRYAKHNSILQLNWQFITGDKKVIYKLARRGFKLAAAGGDGGPEDFIHSNKLVLVDGKQRIRGYYDGTSAVEVKNMMRDISKLQNE